MTNEKCRIQVAPKFCIYHLPLTIHHYRNASTSSTVFGMGFAPFHGGLLRYGEARGLTEIANRLGTLAQAPDIKNRPGGPQRFTPADILVKAASAGGKLE